MIERILVPLDGSPLAEAALPQLGRLLKLSDAEVVLLHVFAVPPVEVDYMTLVPRLHEAAKSYVAQVQKQLASQGLRTRAIVREGPTAETILQVAEEEGVSLIAMSTHGRTGLARWVLGSVAEKVLRASRTPVLVVRSFRAEEPGRPAPPTELPFTKVLLPVDGSPLSIEGVEALAPLIRPLDARVILLHVYEHPGGPRLPLDEAASVLSDAGIPTSLDFRLGDPAEEIIEAAREHDADLIAMATHGRSGLSRWVVGSVTEKVLRAATLPMLIVRPGKK